MARSSNLPPLPFVITSPGSLDKHEDNGNKEAKVCQQCCIHHIKARWPRGQRKNLRGHEALVVHRRQQPPQPGEGKTSIQSPSPTSIRVVMKRSKRRIVSAVLPQPIGGFHLTMSLMPHVYWAYDPYLEDKPRQTGFRRPAIDLPHHYD